MSEDDRDLDIESDDDNLGPQDFSSSGPGAEDEKRAHHNALERKRRDHIKDSFTGLKDSIPTLQGDKISRAQILKKATEYIVFMRRKNVSHGSDIDDLKKQNQHLENQIRILEQAKVSGRYDLIKEPEKRPMEEEGDERKRLKSGE
eukprot:TRINITY_DN46584_c0_g1_i1.p1 TRINITY_DN46584_c0_g1~~TRINITY_DN46584_c0_g1_i1.p1  ORF type:complete len:153 (-),score=26.39 TRINITY_DN46584_c0_g1_i1:138-575(-)